MSEKKSGKTFLGRDAESWRKILGFYFCFYTVIVGIFIIFIAIFAGTCPDDAPLLVGRALQSPGLSYMPNLDYKTYSDWITAKHREIDYKTAFVYKKDTDEHLKYADKMKAYFDEVEDEDRSHLGDCQVYPYGFGTVKPCLFFKMNRIIDWEPVGIFPEDILNFFTEGKTQTLSQSGFCDDRKDWCSTHENRIEELFKSFNFTEMQMTGRDTFVLSKAKPTVRCIQYSDTTPLKNVTYWPESSPTTESGELNWVEPFEGGKTSTYRNPLMAVQFDLGGALDEDHRFYCFGFDRNIELDFKKMISGVSTFYMKINS